MKIKVLMLSLLFMLYAAFPVGAKKISVSTNLLGYAALGTMNAELSYSVARKWSITADFRYNPFTFGKANPRQQFQMRQQSYSLGARYWLWHTMSGWWLSSKLRYQEYNCGGIFSRQTEEGDRLGVGLCSGYTYMLAPHLNMEFGIGLWGGVGAYKRYSCPKCGLTVGQGRKFFLLPDDIMISLVYVF